MKELNLRRGLHVVLREALKELQQEHGGGPLCNGPVSAGLKGTLATANARLLLVYKYT